MFSADDDRNKLVAEIDSLRNRIRIQTSEIADLHELVEKLGGELDIARDRLGRIEQSVSYRLRHVLLTPLRYWQAKK